jgi:hypothetical protein
MPLPLLLSEIDLHISWNSSVCIEAACLGVKSLLMDTNLLPGGFKEKYYEHLVGLGYVDKIQPCYDDIEAWVVSTVGHEVSPYERYYENYESITNEIMATVK